MCAQAHVPVMLEESTQALKIKPDGTYLDCTFGRGGHSEAFLKSLSTKGRLYVIDQDETAIQTAHEKYGEDERITILHNSFEDLDQIGEQYNLLNNTDGIFFDLGVSSPQLDNAERGFSFTQDGPLDMRMNNTSGQTASQWLEQCSLSELIAVLRNYGEERYAKKIATQIMSAQQDSPLTSTLQLAEIIKSCYPRYYQGIHPATRSFQAIRIAVNRELDALSSALNTAYLLLKTSGIMAVISFHSLEDRMVKRFIRDTVPKALAKLPIPHQPSLHLKPMGKLQRPSEQEIDINQRSRSARLRVAQKVFE
jgi:16S rRNA (cytosine1402-N4)-methyltransferase